MLDTIAVSNKQEDGTMATWYVTGRDMWTMKPKTVKVTAPSKAEAITKGLKKIDTHTFFNCTLIKA